MMFQGVTKPSKPHLAAGPDLNCSCNTTPAAGRLQFVMTTGSAAVSESILWCVTAYIRLQISLMALIAIQYVQSIEHRLPVVAFEFSETAQNAKRSS